MYFVMEGTIGIGFRLFSNKNMKNPKCYVGKLLHGGPKASIIICDHYVINA